MKKHIVSILLTFLIAFSITSIAFAVDYTLDDLGDIQGTEILLDGVWYSRPGLDTFPSVSGPYEYNVKSTLLSGTPINEVVLYHGPPDGSFTDSVTAMIIDGNIEVLFTPDEGTFNYCKPQWDYSFYLLGFQDGTNIEIDERHYLDGTGGDPYSFAVENPDVNQPPVTDPGGPYIVNRGESEFVTLDGSGSFDPEGFSLTYAWDVYVTWEDYQPMDFVWDDEFDDGTGPNPEIYFDESGLYHVRLKVTDECGEETIAETILMVYDPHIVVSPQNNDISGLNWHKGMDLTLFLDGLEIATLPVQGPEEGLPEKDGYMAGFQLNDYGIEEILPGTLVRIEGVVDDTTVIREHVVRDFYFEIDYENDIVFGGSEIRLPSPPEENYVRVRIEDPDHIEIVSWADEVTGDWSANFSGLADLTEETYVQVLQQNYDDSSHTFRYHPEEEPPQPHFTIQPDHGWAFGRHWPVDVEVTLVIDEDTDPNNGTIYTATSWTVPAGGDPNIGVVSFEFGEITEFVQPGQYVTMTDGETTKGTFIYDMAFETLDPTTETASGYGPANRPGSVYIGSDGFHYDSDVVGETDGSWMADFIGQGIDFSNIQDANVKFRDDDGDGTMVHLLLESQFLGGDIAPNPVPVGEPVTITAEYLEGYYPIDTMEISFFQTDPPDWIPLDVTVVEHQATGTTTLSFDQPGVYPVGTRSFTTQGHESGGFIGLLVVYDPDGGFVTGGGTIWSPLGAYYPDPELEGKANFGFVSKYKKGAIVPTGQTEFQFHVADMNFHSSSYEWLVVAGKKAMYKGVGTINGEGEFKFMLSAIDGDLKGGDGIDKFRIRIWEEVDGMEVMIYDNQLGDWPEADPSTSILKGSIQIHKSK
jgi:hypothetical protein